MRIEHAVEGGAADAQQLGRAQLVAIATKQGIFDVPADYDIQPPVPQINLDVVSRSYCCG